MSQIQYVDELIREYLLFRGFSGTLKVFDSELKVDKDRGFRVDKIVEQLMQFINAYDLNSLRELWLHLDQKIFSKLEHHFTPAVRKLENAVLKLYLVNAVLNNKPDKVTEFFSKMTPDLQNQPEWKEWFMLPFMKYPEENPSFAVHFTRQWQDTLLVSLHNFLATSFQCMPQPTLSSYEEDATRMRRLQEENEALKLRITMLLDNNRTNNTVPELGAPENVHSTELMDDFYIIAQEALSTNSENQSKTLKSLIRNIGSGLPTSPILSRKTIQSSGQVVTKKLTGSASVEEQQHKRHSSKTRQSSIPSTSTWVGGKAVSTAGATESGVGQTKRAESRSGGKVGREPSVESMERKVGHVSLSKPTTGGVEVGPALAGTGPFLLLSQEEYNEHRSSMCHCKFNSSGSAVASADADGFIKLWSSTPSPKTLATFVSKSSVLSLAWVTKNERYFITGHKLGLVRLYDTRENKMVWELGTDLTSPLRDSWVVDVCCNPAESSFVCSTVSSQGSGNGKLLLYDIKTRKLERCLLLDPVNLVANCCTFNHNGQLLFAGCSDGTVRMYDLRRSDCIDVWSAHQGSVEGIQLTTDFTSCFTMARDGKLCQRSLNQNGQVLWESVLPDVSSLQNVTSPHGQLFTFDSSGTYVLMCGPTGGNIFQIGVAGLTHMLELGGHRSPAVAVDWAIANQCATCVTASADGKIRMSTLLTP